MCSRQRCKLTWQNCSQETDSRHLKHKKHLTPLIQQFSRHYRNFPNCLGQIIRANSEGPASDCHSVSFFSGQNNVPRDRLQSLTAPKKHLTQFFQQLSRHYRNVPHFLRQTVQEKSEDPVSDWSLASSIGAFWSVFANPSVSLCEICLQEDQKIFWNFRMISVIFVVPER